MNCPRCGTPKEETDRFCSNCGMSFIYKPPVTAPVNSNQPVVLLLIIMAWEALTSLLWLLLQKFLSSSFRDSGMDMVRIYNIAGWVFESITIILLIIFSVIIRNNTARIFLIIFAVIKFGLLLWYRLFREK